jgi:hypothetical protein
MTMKITVWDKARRSLVERYKHPRGIYCLHLQARQVIHVGKTISVIWKGGQELELKVKLWHWYQIKVII